MAAGCGDAGAGYCAVSGQRVTGTTSGVKCCWSQAPGPPVIPSACAVTAGLCAVGSRLTTQIYAGCVDWYGDNGFYTRDGGIAYFVDASGIPTDAALYDSAPKTPAPDAGVGP